MQIGAISGFGSYRSINGSLLLELSEPRLRWLGRDEENWYGSPRLVLKRHKGIEVGRNAADGLTGCDVVLAGVEDYGSRLVGSDDLVEPAIHVLDLGATEATIENSEWRHIVNERLPEDDARRAHEQHLTGWRRRCPILSIDRFRPRAAVQVLRPSRGAASARKSRGEERGFVRVSPSCPRYIVRPGRASLLKAASPATHTGHRHERQQSISAAADRRETSCIRRPEAVSKRTTGLVGIKYA